MGNRILLIQHMYCGYSYLNKLQKKEEFIKKTLYVYGINEKRIRNFIIKYIIKDSHNYLKCEVCDKYNLIK